jgi:ABC-type branched-subunit amino acid transport system substrate-binding protein
MFGWRNSQPKDPTKEYTTRQADFIELQGGKKVALVGTSLQSSAVFVDQIDEAIKKTKKGKVKVVLKTTNLTANDVEFTGLAQEIKDAGADTLFTGMETRQNAPLIEALEQVGAEVDTIILPGGYDSRLPAAYPAFEGAFFGIEFLPFELDPPAFADYSAAMEGTGKPFEGQVPYIGWLTADTFIKGLEEAGLKCPTREAFINNLRIVDDWDGHGAFEPVDFSKAFGKIFPCVHYVQVVNGAFEVVNEGKPVCAQNVIKNGKVIKIKPSELEGV